jgi:5'-deoxynucleotidase YfbR-like HD superfamily hydrolase
MLAYVIAVDAPMMFFGPSERMALFGMIHDLPEVFTGDIPAHTKAWMKTFCHDQFDSIEHQVTPSQFKIPYENEKQKRLVKLCDLADGIRFIRLYGVDTTAHHAHDQLFNKYVDQCLESKKEWPHVILYHVVRKLNFYAFETRIATPPPDIKSLEKALDIDMA